jgi:hypothetical protein
VNLRTTIALAVGIVLVGYVLAVRPLEARIADRYAFVAAARATIDDGSALRLRIDAAESEKERLHARLARYALDARPAASVGRFLAAAGSAAQRHGAMIRALDAEPSPIERSAASTAPFAELPLRLTLRGSYTELLATLRDLIAAPLASRIALEGLAPDDRRRAGSTLVAAVHVVLLRLPERRDVRTEPH